MRIAIVGAGLGGLAAAWELTRRGHEVTVFEQRAAVAAEGSFALPGLHARWAAMPWCLPGVPRRRLARWLKPGGSLAVPLALAWLRAGWGWQHWRADAVTRAAPRSAALHALAALGSQRLAAMRAELHHDVEQAEGALLLWRNPRALDRARRAVDASPLAQDAQWLDEAACHALEPHLNRALPLSGGLRLPEGGAANARQWAQHMKSQAQVMGARFLFETEVLQVHPGTPATLRHARAAPAGPSRGSAAAFDEHRADAVVLSAGVGSARLLARAGLRLALQPVTTYTVTAPLGLPDAHSHAGPLGAVLDIGSGISMSRLGQRLRVGGVQALGSPHRRHLAWAGQLLHRTLEAHFPGGAVHWRAQIWSGARARLPDGAPVVGSSGLPGVWLHTGHGACSWSLSCGSAALLGDLIDGHPAAPELAWLGCTRLGLRR